MFRHHCVVALFVQQPLGEQAPQQLPHKKKTTAKGSCLSKNFLRGGERGIRTPGTVIPYDSLANCWFKPLTHLSVLDLKSRAKIRSFCVSANLFEKKYLFWQFFPLSLSPICTVVALKKGLTIQRKIFFCPDCSK